MLDFSKEKKNTSIHSSQIPAGLGPQIIFELRKKVKLAENLLFWNLAIHCG